MDDYSAFKITAGEALASVSYTERVTEIGPGREWFVTLPDGYTIPCGIQQGRADDLALLFNFGLQQWRQGKRLNEGR